MARPNGTPKTGGRKTGTPNRATETVREKLVESGCDLAVALAEIATNVANDLALRAEVYADLLPYIAARPGDDRERAYATSADAGDRLFAEEADPHGLNRSIVL